MGLSDGRKSFPIGLAVLIQYRSVTPSHPASHVAVAITLNALAKASSLIKGCIDNDRQFEATMTQKQFSGDLSHVCANLKNNRTVEFRQDE